LKDIVPWSGRLAIISALTLFLLFEIPGGDYLCAIPAAYLTVYIGLLNPRKIWFLRGADYSYGIYLYGFVVQQTVEQFGWARHWWLNMPLSLAGAAMFAALSWHLVEKPALKLRRFLPPIEQAISRLRLPGLKPA
jgi:peptidoglycan/LPS O-acetylase OafA/YrhL